MRAGDVVGVGSGVAGLFCAAATVAFFPAGASHWLDATAGFCVAVVAAVGGQAVLAGVGPRARGFLVAHAVLSAVVAALTGSVSGAAVGVGTVLAVGAAADRWREAMQRGRDLADRRAMRRGWPGRRGVLVKTPGAALRARGARDRVLVRTGR